MEFQYTEIAPSIYIFDNAIKNHKELLSLFENEDKWNQAKIYNDSGALVDDDSYRTSKNIFLNVDFTCDENVFFLGKYIFQRALFYAKQNQTSMSSMEQMQVLKYEPGDFYKAHSDSSPSVYREFSAVAYLNECEGGETFFEKFNISVKPKPGRLVIFPANFSYRHSAKPPISGNKFVVVTWFQP
jgi:Rps23 Pro-64 3,4-dihydroxylase Tpa1-like proline 4-hydroxylase